MRLSRLWLLGLVAFGLYVPGVAAHAADDTAKPRVNILLFFTDDQRWDTVSALGNPEIKTPNFDAITHRGFHFENAYCMGAMVPAVCLPSRTMLLTGHSLWRIAKNPRAKEVPPGVTTLPGLLNDAGYKTFHCGKAGNSCTFAHNVFQTNIESKTRTADSAREHVEHAIDFLNAHDGKAPFFLYLAPPVPHDPRLAPEEFVRMYDPAKLTLSKNFMPRHPFDNGELMIRDEMLAPHPRTPEVMKQHLADYYATISDLDHQFGRLVETLKARGFLDNTVIIFSSDQGLAVGGRHGLMGKQNLYEHVKPPLVFAGPGIPVGESDALVYLFDLYPTICELAGVKIPANSEGRSLLPVIRGQKPWVRSYLLGAYKDCQRMVRDDRWKLLKYNAKGVKNVQMFDLRSDPDELHNLADDPKHAAERVRLEALMKALRKKYDDPVNFD